MRVGIISAVGIGRRVELTLGRILRHGAARPTRIDAPGCCLAAESRFKAGETSAVLGNDLIYAVSVREAAFS